MRTVTMAMIATVVLAGASLAAAEAAERDKPRNALIGTWACDPSISTFNGAMPYRSATAKFIEVERGTHVIVDIVEANGVPLHFEYIDTEDGTFVPVHGNPFYDNESTVWVDERTARRTERRGEEVTGTTIMTVAPDGKSYVARSSRTRPDGRLYTSLIHWKRAE